ncbi:hypothetical protein [Lentzea albidocapillata]|uniref:Uncharacterized protein n=1 Tax=Lentzea albidocapillata TaxID=40571 RepID=A0A1W2FSH0_9PSEU|nr:hypothetical protein [Lentzea albidocapillata]SMD24568.1 hypothetical protein SAMN05660733_07741 [Lentzea albidocapillata]
MSSKDLVDAFSLFALRTVLAPESQLPDIPEHVYGELKDFLLQHAHPGPIP